MDPPAIVTPGCTVHEGLQRLVLLLPRVMRGLRRSPTETGVDGADVLGPRHRSALALVRDHQASVSALAATLGLNLATTSGLVADLERVGFVERFTDPTDRRRTIVRMAPGRQACVDRWLQGATAPIVRVLEQLSPEQRTAFVTAMAYLDAELNSEAVTS
jgi:DNA-binding MarR family transcriptional regulator